MGFTIKNIIHTFTFEEPNRKVAMLEVHYVTDNDYRGVVNIPEAGATKESIIAAVQKAAALPDSLIGQNIIGKK